MYYTELPTPIGLLTLCCDDHALKEILFGSHAPENATRKETPLLSKVISQLNAYFTGQRQAFDLPLAPEGTDFQQTVWKQLLNIPFGVTHSYQWQARQINRPNAVRAVGAANGKNPIPIIIPCHRVIASNAKLTGYAGGLSIKKALLEHEGHQIRKNTVC